MNAEDCNMGRGCAEPVTHIGSKGYVYCATHAVERRSYGVERTRKMAAWELQAVLRGEALLSYSHPSYAAHVARYGTLGTVDANSLGGVEL